MWRVEGVAKVVSVFIDGVGMGRGEDGGARCFDDSGVDGAAAPTGPRGKNRVKRMRLGGLRKFTEKRGSEGSTGDEMLRRVARLRQDANGQRGGYERLGTKRDGKVGRGGAGAFIGEVRGHGSCG